MVFGANFISVSAKSTPAKRGRDDASDSRHDPGQHCAGVVSAIRSYRQYRVGIRYLRAATKLVAISGED